MDFKTFASALRIRMIEQEISARYSQQEMRCPVHLSIGQELNAAKLCSFLTPDDLMVSGHRAHAHYLAKGGNLGKFIAELYGKEAGCSRGFGGSMHLVDQTCGFYGSTSIVAGTIPVGTGLALSKKLRNESGIIVICFGDAALEQGVTHESINFATLHRLPVLFFCENNEYSCNIHINKRQPGGILNFARGIPVSHDIENAVTLARMNQPVLCEIKTKRYAEHCGPRYRLPKSDELNQLMNEFPPDKVQEWKEFVKQEIQAAFEFALNSSYPKQLIRPLCEEI